MTRHTLPLSVANLHGYLSRDRAAVLTVAPGDRVVFRTLDVSWSHWEPPLPMGAARRATWPPGEHHTGHCISGPVHVIGAPPGMTLEIRILRV